MAALTPTTLAAARHRVRMASSSCARHAITYGPPFDTPITPYLMQVGFKLCTGSNKNRYFQVDGFCASVGLVKGGALAPRSGPNSNFNFLDFRQASFEFEPNGSKARLKRQSPDLIHLGGHGGAYSVTPSESATFAMTQGQSCKAISGLFRILDWEGCHESRTCSRDTYPESYKPKYASIRRSASKR